MCKKQTNKCIQRDLAVVIAMGSKKRRFNRYQLRKK
jgi:hypothetical protein